ncbi:MAG: poly-gamma-glutamate system protein [bacterium]|nr:poly-gamma-glutamate system protein [bacterium]
MFSLRSKIKMFKPSLRDPTTLVILAILSILCFIWAETSRRQVRLPNYETKLLASRTMLQGLQVLRQERFGNTSPSEIDPINDPNATALIGRQDSPITTESGNIEWALTSLNPNMAAAVVSYLMEANLKKGDVVAVSLTGSLPGLNLATLCAIEALQLKPIIITAVGSAQWGANDPDFTWLDMERILYEKRIIHHRSVVATIGGGGDYGRGLSDKGRIRIRDAIARNGVELFESLSLDSSIAYRMRIYEMYGKGKPKLFLTVGGGAAALGHPENAQLIPTGYSPVLPSRNYPNRGVLHEYADQGIPFIHLYDAIQIAIVHHLPKSPVPLPAPGSGGVYSTERYDIRVTAVALAIFLLFFGIVVEFDRRRYALKEEGVDPDTLPISK